MGQTRIKFGTDGWRARIADSYTYSSVRRCTAGFAAYILETEGTDRPIVIGYDMRFASEDFAITAAEVLAAAGFKVHLTDGPTPTPVISFSVPSRNAAGAINITASHNPPSDNGFKVRDRNGGAIAPAGLTRIEASIPDSDDNIERIPYAEAVEKGLIERFDAAPAYIEQLKRMIDLEPIRQAGLHVLVDPMWGNGAGWFTELLSGGSTVVTEIHNERNPTFPEMIRPEPIPPNIDPALAYTTEINADVCIINDGDADRVGLGDEHGQFVNQLQVYALLADYLLEIRGERGPIVKTLSTTSMLNTLGTLYNVPVFETGVGFKYVAPKMMEVDALIGGEESGGYAFRGHVPERDGILAGLYLLDMMVQLQKKPSELVAYLFDKVGAHYYDRIDTKLPGSERKAFMDRMDKADPAEIAGLKVTGINRTDGHKFCFEDGGWLLVRFSGTEPVVRVYCETTKEDKVQAILQDGLKLLGIA
ncbi:MAG: phosphoglucomutase/phosphomannomutase family protein [Anaerolineales bacterium]|nr:phosphoglucomutase/phosphomannomutase family protein [Anaerolineales bacterium]